MLTRVLAITCALTLAGCVVSHHATEPAALPAASGLSSWDTILAQPGVLTLDSVASARWETNLKGLVNLDHPEAVKAGLTNSKTRIVLPLHLLKHPTKGVFIVDTGIDVALAEGGRGGTRGLFRPFLKSIEPGEPLGKALARQGAPLAGVLITHTHIDHILGLPDVPLDVPVYVGPADLSPRAPSNVLAKRTYRALLKGRGPLKEWDFSKAQALDPFPAALDVVGDGSLWALSTPGHTPGSTSYLAMTTDGPVLFTGDTCHTIWGWEHGVEPGTFTVDGPTNVTSLGWLRAFVQRYPQVKVFVGHELDGEGTGVEPK